jgi:hypothetical protein
VKYPDGDEEDMGCRDMSKYLGDKFQCGLIRNPPTAAEQPASELRRERRARRVHGRSNPLDGVEEELHQYAKGAEFELPARYAEFAGTKWRLLRVYYDDSTGRQMAAYCTTEIADTIPPIDVETLPLEDLEAEYDVEASEYTRVQSWIAASAATEVVVQETSGRRQSRRVAGERPSHVRDPNSWSGGTIPNPEAASTPHEVHRLRGGRQGDDDPDYNQPDYEIPCDHEAGFMGEAVNHVYQEQYIFPFQPQIPIQIQLQQFQENPPHRTIPRNIPPAARPARSAHYRGRRRHRVRSHELLPRAGDQLPTSQAHRRRTAQAVPATSRSRTPRILHYMATSVVQPSTSPAESFASVVG